MADKDITFRFLARDAQFDRVSNRMGKNFRGLSSLASGLKGKLATMFGGYALLRAGRRFVDLAMESAEVEARRNQVLRATAQSAGFNAAQLDRQARSLQRVTTVSDEAVTAAQSVMLTFTQVRGDVFEKGIEAALDMAEVFGTDLKNATVQLGKALNDPLRGLTALRRIGVSFNEEQKNQIAAFVKTNRLAEAQAVILNELKAEFGGVAEAAAKSEAGGLKQFENRLRDLEESLGEGIMPYLNQVVEISEKLDRAMGGETPGKGMRTVTEKLSKLSIFGIMDAVMGAYLKKIEKNTRAPLVGAEGGGAW